MKVKKPQSKRTSTRLQKGIQKKIAAHQRKERKKAKKDVTWKSRVPKDPGIPNSFPYKGKILAEMEEHRKAELEERERLREEKRAAALASGHNVEQVEQQLRLEEEQDNTNRLAALVASAQEAAREYNDEQDSDDAMEDDDSEEEAEIEVGDFDLDVQDLTKESSRRAFDKIYRQVVENSDVVLYVLDARNPEGTRSRQVEHAVLADPNKRLIYVLNKIDLIPDEVLHQWKEYLEKFFPVIPLAASSGASNAQTFDHKGLTQATTATALLQALKKYAHDAQKQRAIAVGVIGYPNVGKSSVINALTSRHGGNRTSCPVGAQAGVTTSFRRVKVDNKLSVWDSPGIVFPSSEGKKVSPIEEQARLVLLNALPPKHMSDLRPAVSLLLKRLSKNEVLMTRLKTTYDIPPIMTTPHEQFVTEFLVHVARKMGRLGKGGVVNLQSSAFAVITDWRDGRIAGWARPPTREEEAKKKKLAKDEPVIEDRTAIVTEWAKEFSLDGLWDPNDAMEE
ncbi:nuclear GTP-binding protein Nug1p [Trichomonascus vanleenenianus]|uniref:RNA-binding GTPase NUG1 n=1 Tax=Trichomonascus vanleenenianus TaxID=2268995 RepID=UPI003ECA141D